MRIIDSTSYYHPFSAIMEHKGRDEIMDMYFLYFPEDKSEYIPASISLAIFMILAIITLYLFYKKSKKDEKYFDEKYELHRQMSEKKENEQHQ